MEKYITLAHGGGGSESEKLIQIIQKEFRQKSQWRNCNDDGATLPTANFRGKKLVLTTDSFIVDPLFFNGGDIGKMAVCGTINDLVVMGAKPIGLSVGLVLEEGFPIADLIKIIKSMAQIARRGNVPLITGDTKVTEKGKLDKIIINTSGIGLAAKVISDSGLKKDNLICANGTLGDHGTVILAHRFNYRTKLKSDCGAIYKEFSKIAKYITAAKDPTRGGLAQCLNEMAEKSNVKIVVNESANMFRKETLAVAGLLGISEYTLPSEGRFVFGIKKKDKEKVKKILKKLIVLGEAQEGKSVIIKTKVGQRILEKPQGKLIPRIC